MNELGLLIISIWCLFVIIGIVALDITNRKIQRRIKRKIAILEILLENKSREIE